MQKKIAAMCVMLCAAVMSVSVCTEVFADDAAAETQMTRKAPQNWNNGERPAPPDFSNDSTDNGKFDFKNGKKPPVPPKDENGNPMKPPKRFNHASDNGTTGNNTGDLQNTDRPTPPDFGNNDGSRPKAPDFKNGQRPPEPPKDENGNPMKPPKGDFGRGSSSNPAK